MHEHGENEKELVFALLVASMEEQEEDTAPRIGIATDRRSLGHVGECFREDNAKTLICFICGCKHVYHHGFDKPGSPYQKGDIEYRTSLDVALHHVLCGSGEKNTPIPGNLSKRRLDVAFGSAVVADSLLSKSDCWEWKRNVKLGCRDTEVLRDPEDVLRCDICKAVPDRVCSDCKIPICSECWNLASKGFGIQKALANDNFIG